MTIGRSQVVLAAMAAGGPGTGFFPIQLQKILFLIDREIHEFVNGPHFHFIPYRYGPFDKDIYIEVNALIRKREVGANAEARYPLYFLTDSGTLSGINALNGFPEPASRYMKEAAVWVRSLTFRQLLAAVYAYFPDMAVNSVMPQLKSNARQSWVLPQPSFLSGVARTIDLMGVLNEYRPGMGTQSQDVQNLGRDWARVGENLRQVMERYGQERIYG